MGHWPIAPAGEPLDRAHKLKAETHSEEEASGIAVEPLTENEILLEEIVEIMQSSSSEQTSNTKISESKEREKALKMRDKAMKTWGKTKKVADQSDSDESDEKMCDNTQKKKAEKRIWCPQVSWGKCPSWSRAEERMSWLSAKSKPS